MEDVAIDDTCKCVILQRESQAVFYARLHRIAIAT